MTIAHRYFFLVVSLLLFLPIVSSLNVDIETPLNQSSLNVNNSQYLQGYTPLTLRTWMEDHFDLVYAPLSSLANYLPLTGGTMSGDINMGGKDISNADTINATSFIGNGSQLTDVGYWNRTGTVLSPKTSGDDITTTGDIYTENLYNNGNVGIGTTTPDEALDVVGNINIASSSAYMYDGVNALKLDKNGEAVYYSTLVGVNAGNAGNVNSTKQTAIGSYAGYENSGTSQTAIGYAAGYSNSGNQQAAIGYYAGLSNSGTYQTAIGYNAGNSNSGDRQAAIGYAAGLSNSGTYQTAIGYAAGKSNSGTEQTAIGYNAGYENEGNQVIGIGYEATRDNEGNDVVAIGYQAGKANTVANQFIVKQANINAVPLIQGDFVTGDVSMAQDNAKLLLGTAQDSSIYYDGTDIIINPAEVGSGSLKVSGDINATGYIGGKNYVTQYHRNASIDTTSANTWVNITWDLTIDDETTSGYSLDDSNASIIIANDGIYRIQGCLHPKNNGVGNQEANLYSRVLIDGVEAKCLQFANSKEFKTTEIDTMPFTGTVYAEAEQKVQLQYYVTSVNIDFEGDAVFDDAVASSINFERISK